MGAAPQVAGAGAQTAVRRGARHTGHEGGVGMSDMTSNAPGTDINARRRTDRTEFLVYFAIVFAAALPLATLTWALSALRTRDLAVKGPVARAWSQARIITPMIFAA